jgi:anti-sigma regulatory factor (Ser/Thr protein kinase)
VDLHTLALPLDPSAGAILRGWLRTVFGGKRLPETSAQESLLAATEALNNALRNGTSRGASVVVTLSIVGRNVYVRVTDRDRDESASLPSGAVEDGDHGATRRLGLALMNGVMDEVHVDYAAEGSSVRLVKRIGGSESMSDVAESRQAV